ncbi:hypothetical protein [Solimicrobium silvestre]|uniref:Uncharacterized protein n=1 Tax=Solimicrobium silvestre TaxID=2099400 RepID=A0A2S9H3T4_9BURK|nr:hypothetical protein [Solimicrobium silvestre]PRC94639.1 hypothetical protein S2091_0642 [Solimicrobium silvestre]
MKRAIFLMIFFVQLFACEVHAQSAASDVPSEENANTTQTIEVRGIKDPEWKPYRIMLKGLDAFDKYHSLAPKADLKFILRPQVPNMSITDVKLHIEANDVSIPIPISEEGTFVIPRNEAAAEQNAEMIINNKKKNTVLWAPYMRTPGIDINSRRMGDMRLECEIVWAVDQDDLPFIIRNIFRLGGGLCKSSHIGVSVLAPRQITSVTMISGARRESLPIGPGGKSFTPPLFDEKWDNDTIFEFQFSEKSAKENESAID